MPFLGRAVGSAASARFSEVYSPTDLLCKELVGRGRRGGGGHNLRPGEGYAKQSVFWIDSLGQVQL